MPSRDRAVRAATFAALVLSLVVAEGVAGAAPASADCATPGVLFVIDRSSSMNERLPSGGSKWEAAREAVADAAARFAEREVPVSVMPFPVPSQCGPGEIVLPLGVHAPDVVLDALGTPPPATGAYTPMAESLEASLGYDALFETGDPHVVLITDGWQWCDPHDPRDRFAPVTATMRLTHAGATVYVVGFGSGVDQLTLGRAAIAAGTAVPECDPDPSVGTPCHRRADDLLGLRETLGTIATEIAEERCDGIDDDCDGAVDEGFDLDADGFGRCEGREDDGTVRPADCDDTDPHVRPGADELCNGIDDDCDGETDPGCSCLPGTERVCGSSIGRCRPGRQPCVDGAWGRCENALTPIGETCDGVDQDCDGVIDETAPCGPGRMCVRARCEGPAPDAGSMGPDAGTAARDTSSPPVEPGCACAVGGTPAPSPLYAGLVASVVVVLRTVRRRRRR